MKVIFLFLVILGIQSCNLKKNENNSDNIDVVIENSSDLFNVNDTIEFQKKIVESGDVYSYGRLEEIYEETGDTLDPISSNLLKYSYIMADKYQYNFANKEIVRDIIRKELKTNDLSLIDSLSPQNKKEVLSRLNKCIEKNEISCIVVLIDYYKRTNNKNQLEKMEKLLDSIMYKKKVN